VNQNDTEFQETFRVVYGLVKPLSELDQLAIVGKLVDELCLDLRVIFTAIRIARGIDP
jgi:hypothetical protein